MRLCHSGRAGRKLLLQSWIAFFWVPFDGRRILFAGERGGGHPASIYFAVFRM